MKKWAAGILAVVFLTGIQFGSLYTDMPNMQVQASEITENPYRVERESDYDKTVYGSAYAFDDLTAFVLNTDFECGGEYQAAGVSLSDEEDHTASVLAKGKSLKMAGRDKVYNRVKLLNAFSSKEFTNEDIGRTFLVSAYLKADAEVPLMVGAHGVMGSEYAANPQVSDTKTVTPNEWTRFEFTYTVTAESVAAGVNYLGIGQKSGAPAPVIYADDIVVTALGKAMIFDNLDSFSNKTDYIAGGDYPNPVQNVVLSPEENHTASPAGKSLKLGGRTLAQHRVKILNLFGGPFTEEDIGRGFTVSCYIKPSVSTSVQLGLYGPENTAHAYSPYELTEQVAEAGKWTQVRLSFTVSDYIVQNGLYMVGIGQPSGAAPIAAELYVDDLIAESDDLVYFSMRQDNPDAIYESLPNDQATTLLTFEDFKNANIGGSSTYNATKSLVSVNDPTLPFDEAMRISVGIKPEIPYSVQMSHALPAGQVKDGDMLLAIVYMRAIASESEKEEGHFQYVVEQGQAAGYEKVLQSDAKVKVGSGWKKFYLPSGLIDGLETELNCLIRLGYEVQTVEFGGFELIHYPASCGLEPEDMPDSTSRYDGNEPGAAWRREALERIETLRKGKMQVLVKDGEGNPLPGALVDVDMTEHEFQFGTAVNTNLLSSSSNAKKYQEAVQTYFNTAVLESSHKWVEYEKNPNDAQQMVSKLEKMGIRYIRGHTLMWDRSFPNGWNDNTSIPKDLYEMFVRKDKEAIDKRIQEHFQNVGGYFSGRLVDWDVVNELVNNNAIRTEYGNAVLNQWFDWARAADPHAQLYINETGITGQNDTALNTFCDVLDYMAQNGVDWDGIGVQAHFSSPCDPVDFYEQLNRLAKYGKRMKITEYDFNKPGPLQGNFTRDIMLLCLSHPNMEGFLMWGFWDGSHWLKNAPLFNRDWTLKESGEEYMDLVFHRWWTDESGTTGADGSYAQRVFYGDHTITVQYEGTKVTKKVTVARGQDNVFEVVFDSSLFTPAKANGSITVFDDLEQFTNEIDFVAGGAYPPEYIALTSEEDHTTGNGKSLKLSNRGSIAHRVKLRNSLTQAGFGGRDLGKTFRVSCWVKTDLAGEVAIGMFGDTNTTYAINYHQGTRAAVQAGKWTKLEFLYTIEEETLAAGNEVTMFGIGQVDGKTIPTIYVDDISVVEITEQNGFEDTALPEFSPFGGYTGEVSLRDSLNHSISGKQALMLDGFTAANQGIMLPHMLSNAQLTQYDIGKTYQVSCWVKPEVDTNIQIGVYGTGGYEDTPHASVDILAKAGQWNKLMLAYPVTQETVDAGVNTVGITQTGTAPLFVDDLLVCGADGYAPQHYLLTTSSQVAAGDEKADVSLTVAPGMNYDGYEMPFTVVLASYENGALKDIVLSEPYVLADDTDTVTCSFDIEAKAGDRLKAFLIERTDSLKPLASTVLNISLQP